MNCISEPNAQSKESGDARCDKYRTVFQPRIDLWETPTDWNLTAELPGVRAEDLNIVVQEGVLTVEGRVQERGHEGSQRRREYSVGGFKRAFHLGENLAVDATDATLKNGVLTLRLPKHESVLPKKIAIKQA